MKKKLIGAFTLSLAVALLTSCVFEFGQRRTVVWTGQLVKDCSGEPEPNREIYVKGLIYEYPGSGVNPLEPDVESEQITSVLTDELGMYHISFEKGKLDAAVLYLKRPGPDLRLERRKRLKSKGRDFAAIPCVKTLLIIKNPIERDSIYIGGMHELFEDYDTTRVYWLNNSGREESRPCASIALNGESLELYYESDFSATSGGGQLNYGYSINDIRKSYMNRLTDTIPNDYNGIYWERKGYPFVDTVTIDLN